jgi:WD40 repeat protein
MRVEWNLVTGHVIGLYDDGCVFKWDVRKMDHAVDHAVEVQAGAINVKCNLAGDFFATSSGDSKLIVWDFEHFRPVYELSLSAGVVDLAISPDGPRIYDLRESYCAIWQPLSLVRRSESSRGDRSKLDALLGLPRMLYLTREW